MTATVSAETQSTPAFSLELSDDQRDIRDWVHGFAESVVRPAAAEWDEREQTPWPVIQEAAKIGLYGFEGIAQFWADETGLTGLVGPELGDPLEPVETDLGRLLDHGPGGLLALVPFRRGGTCHV